MNGSGGVGKYWLTGDFFDFLRQDHPWKPKGASLNVTHVVDDPKHASTAGKMQKKLSFLVDQMRATVADPATFLRPLESQLSVLLCFQRLEATVFANIPKSRLRDQWQDEIAKMIAKLSQSAADQLTGDARAVLHEFKNMIKTLEFLNEMGANGITMIDDYTNDDGTIKAQAFVERFQKIAQSERDNYTRVKLPFTQETSRKLAVCARHSRPLVAQALAVHSQQIYNLAFDLHIQLTEFAGNVRRKIEVSKSSLDRSGFMALATPSSSLPMKKFPRFLPNLSVPDPDAFLVASFDGYKLILGAYADYVMHLDKVSEPWGELIEILEMWQRTCAKANSALVTKGPVPDIRTTPVQPVASLTRSLSGGQSALPRKTDPEDVGNRYRNVTMPSKPNAMQRVPSKAELALSPNELPPLPAAPSAQELREDDEQSIDEDLMAALESEFEELRSAGQ